MGTKKKKIRFSFLPISPAFNRLITRSVILPEWAILYLEYKSPFILLA